MYRRCKRNQNALVALIPGPDRKRAKIEVIDTSMKKFSNIFFMNQKINPLSVRIFEVS